MMTLLKNVGKGILYIIGLPFFLIVLLGTAVMGLFMLIFMFFKSIILFFTGRSLNDDLPEDIKVKQIKTGRTGSTTVTPSQESEEPIIQPYVAPQNTASSIEETVFGHPTYEAPVHEEPVIEPVKETPVVNEEPVEEPVSSIEIEEPAPDTTEIDIGQYVPHTSGSRFIDEEEEEEDSGVTIEYGDDDE